ncbi:MAG: hypothetical protein GYB18_02030 [Oceanospirillales bacterium]|nr:hypothetical protein [Oceanospirillales bacterium]
MYNSKSNSGDTYQDSYIAVTNKGVVVDHCPTNADVSTWMAKHIEHQFLITSTVQAMKMLGQPLPGGDVQVILL